MVKDWRNYGETNNGFKSETKSTGRMGCNYDDGL